MAMAILCTYQILFSEKKSLDTPSKIYTSHGHLSQTQPNYN